MKDRYTKIINNLEKAATRGYAYSEIRFIRWKLFPIIHEMLESTSLSKTLSFDVKALLKCKEPTLKHRNKNDSVVDNIKCEVEDDDKIEADQRDNSVHQNDDEGDDEITFEEHDVIRRFASGATSSNGKFAFVEDNSTPAVMTTSSSSQHKHRKRMRESDNSIGSHSEDWTAHVESMESKRQSHQKAVIDPEDDEITFFTSFVKCRLVKFDRKKRISIMHQIENILFTEEMETLYQ
ncbi:hypothetical protein CHUAL_011893 [Chamberlinius hualienensis]